MTASLWSRIRHLFRKEKVKPRVQAKSLGHKPFSERPQSTLGPRVDARQQQQARDSNDDLLTAITVNQLLEIESTSHSPSVDTSSPSPSTSDSSSFATSDSFGSSSSDSFSTSDSISTDTSSSFSTGDTF